MKSTVVKLVWAVLLCSTGLSQGVCGEVLETSTMGFAVLSREEVPLTAEDAYGAFLRVAEWWDPQHTWGGDASTLSIEPRAGGCFCERLENGGSVRHASVEFAASGKILRLSGGLGPLQEHALVGTMTVSFKAGGSGSQVELLYRVGGYVHGSLGDWAPIVDGVLAGQLARFGRFARRGRPD